MKGTLDLTRDFMSRVLPFVPYHVVPDEPARALVPIPFPAPPVGPTDGVLVLVADVRLRPLGARIVGDFSVYAGVVSADSEDGLLRLEAVARRGAKLPLLTARGVGGSIITDLHAHGLSYRR